jgi:hypothetical protein
MKKKVHSNVEVFKWNAFKLPKVIRRKLGKEKCYGLYVESKIHLEERLKGKKELEVLIHEMDHHLHQQLDEETIIKIARQKAELLWREGYRKVDTNEQ